MNFRLVLIDHNGHPFKSLERQHRQTAINKASQLVNSLMAETVKVYCGVTRIYTARTPK